MTDNIIGLITKQLGGSLTDAARKITGLGAERTESTVRAAIPAMLAGIMGASSSSSSGRQALESALRTHASDDRDDLASRGTDDDHELRVGSGLLSMRSVLGESQLEKLSSAVGNYAGGGKGMGRSIIGLLSPVVLGVLSRQQRLGNTNVDGLLNMLAQQRTEIANAIPSELAKPLRSAGLLDKVADGTRAAAYPLEGDQRAAAEHASASMERARHAERRSSASWLLGIGALAVVVGLLWALTRGDGTPERAEQRVGDTASEIAAAPSFRVDSVDIADELRTVTDGLTRTLRGVTSEASATAALPQITMASGEFDRLASLAARLPPEAKPALANAVASSTAGVRAELQRVGTLDGVSADVQQAVDSVGTKLDAFMTSLRSSARG